MVVVKVIRGRYGIVKTLALRCVSFFSIHQLDWLVLEEPGSDQSERLDLLDDHCVQSTHVPRRKETEAQLMAPLLGFSFPFFSNLDAVLTKTIGAIIPTISSSLHHKL
jgi:hypothetical protein